MNYKKLGKITKDFIKVINDERSGFTMEFDNKDFTSEALGAARQIRGDE